MTRLFADLTPLRVSAPYRRLWSALGIANVGQQMTSVAVGLQVWDITGSSLMVGLVGLFQLVPLVGFGLYGGTLSDAFDRRKVGVVSAAGLWVCSMAFLAQSLLQWNEVSVLYLVVAVQSAFFAVGNPARQSIIPRIVPAELLPAANALGMITWNVGFTLGPVLGGLLVAFTGTVTSAYAVDVVAFAVVLWAMLRLPSLPPIVEPGSVRPRAGWAAVKEGFVFLQGKRNLQMTFYQDIVAMVFGMPRALFPAIAAQWYGGTTADIALVLGLLSAAPAAGCARLRSAVRPPRQGAVAGPGHRGVDRRLGHRRSPRSGWFAGSRSPCSCWRSRGRPTTCPPSSARRSSRRPRPTSTAGGCRACSPSSSRAARAWATWRRVSSRRWPVRRSRWCPAGCCA